ncbi:MAG: response regulator [Cryomorphaceae bacterium]
MTQKAEQNKILVVDDEEDIGFLMRMLLKSEGYEVVYVKTLSDAKLALKTEIFHTVFLDLNLENEYGLDLVSTIRKQSMRSTIAVITAQKEPRVRRDVEESDVDFLVEKPFNRKKILEVLITPQ